MKALLSRYGVDRAVFLTLTARLWAVSGGLLTLVFVTRHLTPVLQGYYYTFYSLVALQIFAELGLTFVMVQIASHEAARLHWDGAGVLQGDAAAKSRLRSLLRFGLAWFGAAALLLVVVLVPGGLYVLGRGVPGAETPLASIVVPWCLLVVFAAVNLVVTAFVAILEGCGRVAEVAALRLAQSFCNVLPLWVVLSLDGGLYALPASAFCTACLGCGWLFLRHRRLFGDLLAADGGLSALHWKSEIWPFQWRIAVSWMSGYLSFQFFNPFLFATHGPVAAGQMGMSLQIISAMNGAVMAWISTKVPIYGRLVAQRKFDELNSLFMMGLKQSLAVLLIGLTMALGALWTLTQYRPAEALRILPLPLMAVLSMAALSNHVTGAQGTYLRAFKQDPFMPLSVAGGATAVLLGCLFIPPLGVGGAVIAYTAGAALIGLLGGTFLFVRKRREYRHG